MKTYYPFISVDMARDQAKSNIKNKERQPPVLEDRGGVLKSPHCVFELTVCREAVSRRQKASSHSQKRTFAGNRQPSEAIQIQKQSYPRITDTPLTSDKQRPQLPPRGPQKTETETRARRRTSLFSNPRPASFKATTEIALELYC